MIHSGGYPAGGFNERNTRADGYQYIKSSAVKISDMYYRMFTGDSNPEVIGKQVLYYVKD